jgi:hypothetical protein
VAELLSGDAPRAIRDSAGRLSRLLVTVSDDTALEEARRLFPSQRLQPTAAAPLLRAV